MSTLADVNAAIAAYQQSVTDLATQMVGVDIKIAAVAEATTTGQANIDAALAARDVAVSAAQAELEAANALANAVSAVQNLAYVAIIDAVTSYVPA
jgi:hypothetical protein